MGTRAQGPGDTPIFAFLQTRQEIWKVQTFLIRFPQRSQLDRRQSFSHLGSGLCSGIKAKVGSHPACFLWRSQPIAFGFVYVGRLQWLKSLETRGGNPTHRP